MTDQTQWFHKQVSNVVGDKSNWNLKCLKQKSISELYLFIFTASFSQVSLRRAFSFKPWGIGIRKALYRAHKVHLKFVAHQKQCVITWPKRPVNSSKVNAPLKWFISAKRMNKSVTIDRGWTQPATSIRLWHSKLYR